MRRLVSVLFSPLLLQLIGHLEDPADLDLGPRSLGALVRVEKLGVRPRRPYPQSYLQLCRALVSLAGHCSGLSIVYEVGEAEEASAIAIAAPL